METGRRKGPVFFKKTVIDLEFERVRVYTKTIPTDWSVGMWAPSIFFLFIIILTDQSVTTEGSMGGDKMEKLLQAAAQVISEKGYANAKISEIAETAGIGKGTVYEYFSSKEALLEGLLQYILERSMQEFGSIDPSSPPLKNIRLMVGNGLQMMEKMGNLITLTFDFWAIAFKDTESRVYKMMQDMHRGMVEAVRQLIEAGQADGSVRKDVDAYYWAMIFFSILDESFIHKIFIGEQFSLERFERETLRLVDTSLSLIGQERGRK